MGQKSDREIKMKSKLYEPLKEFLTAYLKWAETVDNEECQQDIEFDKKSGLCDNYSDYCEDKDIPYEYFDNDLRDLLIGDFTKGIHCYPFGGQEVYDREVETETHHKNELRLNWIREKLETK